MVYTDYEQTSTVNVGVENSDGSRVNGEMVEISILVPVELIPELLQNYDPASGTSPSVTYSRPLSRAILDALRRYEGVQ
jgi:hypothetical protein